MIEEINLDKNQPQKSAKAPTVETGLPITNHSGRGGRIRIKSGSFLLIGGIVVIVGLGVLSGWLLSSLGGGGTNSGLKAEVSKGEKPKKGEEFGVQDEETFSDHATGELAEGGVDGDGTHHLVREGGDSQTVYLFSSVLDLDTFIGRQVEVWGETFSSEKAGWLMDVGKLKVLD